MSINSKLAIKRRFHPANETSEAFNVAKLFDIEICGAEKIIFNNGGAEYDNKLFAIHGPFGNFSKCYGILWSEGEHTVLDDACDEGLLDSLQMDEKDIETDENGDELNCIRLGNASEPFDAQDLVIQEITSEMIAKEPSFCIAVGIATGDCDIKNLQQVFDRYSI